MRLNLLLGDAFTHELANYVRPRLRSGKPSLFSELKSLYARDDKFVFLRLDKVSSHTVECPETSKLT